MHLFVAEPDSRSAYAAGYYDLSKMEDPKMTMARIEEGMIKKHGGKITSYQAMQVGNHPATKFQFVFGDIPDDSSEVRLISAGQRVYVLIVVFPTAQPRPDERNAFFNSFEMQ